ncbi:hypothetical protein DRQ25_02985 [Candidatus Fermentibacteria bacterium]|nr:MAG: hypothetical protein DRQ25_02985 [Candidatus Fermentibacteria bacterium]
MIMNPVTPIIAVLAIAGIIIWIAIMTGRKRTAAWEGVAQRLGATFTPKGSSVFATFPFQLFNAGSNRKMKNHLQWESEGVTTHLGDYQYTIHSYTGRNRTSKTFRQTVCILEKEGLDLPRTYLRRQMALLDWVGNKFGAQDINFEEDTEFSKAFVLKGDEVRTPQIVGPELRQHLLQSRKAFKTIEMNGNALMMNFGKRRKPEEYADLVALAMPVYYMADNKGSAW